MMKKLMKVGILAGLIAISGYFTNTDAQSVSGSIGKGTVTRGTPSRATVVLSVPGGLHVNSNRPSGEYMIATTVRATSNGAKIGAVSYPPGHKRKFEFSEQALNVYEGRVSFGFNVTVPAGFKGNSVPVRVVVKYQACTNQVCYPPKSKEVTLTARVK